MSIAIALIFCNVATVVLTILTMIYSIRLWQLRSVRWLLVLSVTFLIGSLCTVSVYIVPNFETKITFFELRILGMAFFTPSWLYFISSVCDRWKWLHNRWVITLFLLPSALNFLLMLFPFTRELLFFDYQPYIFHDISVLRYKFGPFYKPLYNWSMLLMLSSYIISAITIAREGGYRRRQVLVLNIGLAAALLSFFFATTEELGWLMGSSVSILFTQIGIMYAVVRYRLLSLVPLAMVRIFRELPDPVFVIDDRNRVLGASDKAIQVFDIPKNYLGYSIKDLLPDLQLAAGEVVFTGKNSRKHYFHLAIESLDKENESSPGKVIFFRDIAEQKNIELRLNEGLEFRARLLALLAHDLTGFVENQSVMSLALQKNASAENRQQLELLAKSAMASQELVNNMMAWVKSQTVHFQPMKRSFEWNMLIKEILEQMQSRLAVKELDVVYTSNANPLFADGDSEMLAAVFRNILSNAIRATPQGKKIYVSLESNATGVEIRIKDEGCGIESEELARICEASQNFLLSGVQKTHGSGIGLMVARHFISLHLGRFDMSSGLGVGTEVFVSIPF